MPKTSSYRRRQSKLVASYVPAPLLEQLRLRADKNDRSLAGEVCQIIKQALEPEAEEQTQEVTVAR